MTEAAVQTWERITSGGETVYWRRVLGRDRYLAVARFGDEFHWAERGSEHNGVFGFVIHREGYAPTAAAARKAADQAISVDREPQPSDGPEYHADHAAWEERQRRRAEKGGR